MIDCDGRDVRVRKLEVRDSTRDESGEPICRGRLNLELECMTKEELGILPFGRAAVAMRDEGQEGVEDDGPNTGVIQVRRTIAMRDYRFATPDAIVALSGKVVNRPRVNVVEGEASLLFTIEVDMTPADVAALSSWVEDPDRMTLTTRSVQQALDLDAEVDELTEPVAAAAP